MIKKGKLFFYGSHGLHLLANALCAGCHECALGVVPQVHLAVPMHLVHLVQDLLDGGRLSCPLDVHCIRKPVCDCRNLDVAVALSARLCSRYDAALRVRLQHDHYTSTTGSCTTCGPSCSKTKQGRALHPSCSSKTARRARQARPNLRLGETLLLTGSDTSCTNCSQISRFSRKNGWKRKSFSIRGGWKRSLNRQHMSLAD